MNSRAMALDKIRENFSSFQELCMFIQMFFLITILPVMLRVFSLSTIMKVLTPGNPKPCKSPDIQQTQDRIVKYTDYILGRNFWIYKHICIKRALVLYHFLSRAGLGVHICFGVRYNRVLPNEEDKKLEGHAWLLYKGDIFLEKDVEGAKTYKMTYCYPLENEQSL